MSHHVFRFAPSPNGYLHLGHAYCAILNHEMARKTGGNFLLRIEDIDTNRCSIAFEEAIYNDLAWLGIEWKQPVRRQSEHFDDYSRALDRLKEMGLVYPSFLTRREIDELVSRHEEPWPRDPDGAPQQRGTEQNKTPAGPEARIAAREPHAWRLNMAKALVQVSDELSWVETGDRGSGKIIADPAAWGDVIIARKDTPTSYHLSVVVDDALQGVTDIVRGDDLYHATSLHCLLQKLLELPQPSYHHHRLINGKDGAKLSKSIASASLQQLRSTGLAPVEIRKILGL